MSDNLNEKKDSLTEDMLEEVSGGRRGLRYDEEMMAFTFGICVSCGKQLNAIEAYGPQAGTCMSCRKTMPEIPDFPPMSDPGLLSDETP